MTIVEVLRADAEYSFNELKKSLAGVTQAQSWAVLPQVSSEYLHSDASIHGLVHHIAGCKRVHASVAFRNSEYRWRDLYADAQRIEPDWNRALEFLDESQWYWMAAWSNLTDGDLEEIRPTNWSSDRSALEIIRTMNYHDTYHAGQIAVVRYGTAGSDQVPPSVAGDILKYCRDMKHW